MLIRIHSLLMFIMFGVVVWVGPNTTSAQDSAAEFHEILCEKTASEAADLAALDQGQPVVKLVPAQDKREVAVCGVEKLQVSAEVFLESFRESMVRKTNPAILEIGSFSSTPTLDDLQSLSIEERDIEDLKDCVVGNCKLKLSAMMIERLHHEVDWHAPDYWLRATQLLKSMLVDYVRDYLARGDAALIEYNDKPTEVRLADEQRSLMAALTYFNGVRAVPPQYPKNPSSPESHVVGNRIVWSKIKYGLKPVTAINHIIIYQREEKTGPQIVVVSKQLYANHYFDSSVALTVFGNLPNASSGSYLFYENRSRVDGLNGPFGRIERGIVENKAMDGLKTILEQLKLSLNARRLSQTESASAPHVKRSWSRWTVRSIYLFLWLFFIAAFIALLKRVRNRRWHEPAHQLRLRNRSITES